MVRCVQLQRLARCTLRTLSSRACTDPPGTPAELSQGARRAAGRQKTRRTATRPDRGAEAGDQVRGLPGLPRCMRRTRRVDHGPRGTAGRRLTCSTRTAPARSTPRSSRSRCGAGWAAGAGHWRGVCARRHSRGARAQGAGLRAQEGGGEEDDRGHRQGRLRHHRL